MNDDPTMSLRDWLDRAQDEHLKAPRAVAEALLARAATLPDDEHGAEAVRLAEHVMLGHLADADSLQRLLDQLPVAPALAAARQRAAWALATLAGDEAPAELPIAAQWRGLQNVVLALAGRGRWSDAADALRRPEAQALVHAELDARKAYAATANNVASELRACLPQHGEQAAAHAAPHVALMLDAAARARRAWAAAGSWLHIERAEYQLALCHAAAGQGRTALVHAQSCLSICEAEAADAVERFFAHEALVLAQRAAGEVQAAADHRMQMRALLAEITDPDMLAWCGQTLEGLRP
ncbi:hypothetical protein [Aquabacterium sp.]|uniref:hypothetical protein n=1 Tax=Aquabacterium sp. TaxID=1872578 RepID=UPI002C4C1869|nr:hypothetical protein [Aquabacterium sp.]HSW04234.1 hypothetical protein [Aquabacterium sp.]